MKTPALSLAALVVALAGPLLPSARADVSVSFDFFQESLSPHGDWIEVGDYGYCWRPNGVSEEWAPYTDGSWAYTDGGWTWVSYEDFGGITYHYGRWVRVLGEGWCWVPGYEWAPAWVSWRSSDDYVGWAPLPPEAHWQSDVGFSIWVDNSYDIGPDYYNFCRVRDFGEPVLGPVICRRSENVTIINNTVNITNITYNKRNSVIFNGGPNFANVNRHAQRPIPALRLVRGGRLGANGGRRGAQSLRGNQLEVFAPRVNRPKNREEFGVRGGRVVGADRINRGWSQIGDASNKERLKEKFARESAGKNAQNARARDVDAQDLDVLPAKADPKARLPMANRRDRQEQRNNAAANVDGAGRAADGVNNVRGEREGANKPAGERLGGRRNEARKDEAEASRERDNDNAAPEGNRGQANALRPFNNDVQDQPDRQAREERRIARQEGAADSAAQNAERELRQQRREQAAQQQDAGAARRQQENGNRVNEARKEQAQQVERQQRERATREDSFRREQQQQNAARQQQQNNAREQAALQQRRQEAVQNQRAMQQQRQAQMQRQNQQAPGQQRQGQGQQRNFQPQQQQRQVQRVQPAPQNNNGGKNRGGQGNGKKNKDGAEERQ